MKRFRHILIALALAAGAAGVSASAAVTDGGAQSEMAASTVSIKVGHGQAELTVIGSSPIRFQIYSITGQLVKSVEFADGTILVELPRGMYIVKCDLWSKQIVVK